MLRFASILVFAGVVSAVTAMVTIDGVPCGNDLCKENEFCSKSSTKCMPCAETCNNTIHNFDRGLCNRECQEYIMNLKYIRTSQIINRNDDYDSVRRLAIVALIVSSTTLTILILLLIYICRGRFSWKFIKLKLQPTKNRVKQYPADLTHHNPHAVITRPRPELKIDIKVPENNSKADSQPLDARNLETRTSQKSQGASTAKTISTALSNRHPAEDTTLDYSYDNMAMNVTPPEQTVASQRF